MSFVSLSDTARRLALTVAETRYNGHRSRGTEHRWNRDEGEHTVRLEAEAIGAEMAVAQLLGRTWEDVGRPDGDGDGGLLGIQVRYTAHPNGRLLVHREDADDHLFFLVTGSLEGYEVHGWILGEEAKAVGEWRELKAGRPCFVVDRSHLREVAEWWLAS